MYVTLLLESGVLSDYYKINQLSVSESLAETPEKRLLDRDYLACTSCTFETCFEPENIFYIFYLENFRCKYIETPIKAYHKKVITNAGYGRIMKGGKYPNSLASSEKKIL